MIRAARVPALFSPVSRGYDRRMGHTVTNRKRATEALRSPLEDFTGWRLAVEVRVSWLPDRARV
jgi:hypothetical protein